MYLPYRPLPCISGYFKEQNEDPYVVDCDAGRCPTGRKVCQFKLAKLGKECVKDKNYGYDIGKPCVLFLLKPVCDFTTRAPSFW